MSKIGKKYILVPKEVKISIKDNKISFEGPKGKKDIEFNSKIFKIENQDSKISVVPTDEKNQNKVLWGLTRSLINNAVIGVSKGYENTIKLNGVGFRANQKGQIIQFQIGYSHDVEYSVPTGVAIKIEKQTTIILNSSDKELLGKVVADLKSLKPVEPYKQKGITSEGQFILKKEGKKK
jgi:large subunit ribosomal protein L6